MRLRKFLALLLALIMLVSIVPAVVFAEETGSETSSETNGDTVIAAPNNLFLNKTAVLNDYGTYTINLEAYATGTTITKTITEGMPLDVVLVMDQSGSLVSDGDLLTSLKGSVTSFLEALRVNGEEFGLNHRVAICGFASYAKQNSSGLALDKFTFANDTQDNAWINTGIFVNGEFLDYGTVEYIPVTSASSISTSKYYVVDCHSNDDGIYEKASVFYSGGKWIASADNENGYMVAAYTTQQLYEKFNGHIYTVGASKNLLTNTDYANSWEYIVDDQGNMNEDITTAVDNLASNGATAIFMGMKMARKMLENLPAVSDGIQRKKIVIVFTDGQPGFAGYTRGDGDAALAEAAKIKASNAEIYAIGMYSDAAGENVDTFMNQLSSNYLSHGFGTKTYSLDPRIGDFDANNILLYSRNIDGTQGGVSPYFCVDHSGNYWPVYIYYDPSDDNYYGYTITDDGDGQGELGSVAYLLESHLPNSDPDADYYKHASDIGELDSIFDTISSEVTGYTSQLTLDANTILKDVLADGFTLTDNTTITVSVVPGSVGEEHSTLTADQLTADKITWGNAQQVLTFTYPDTTTASNTVTVDEAADRTEMTLTATAASNGVVTVTGFNYANATDDDKINAQYICYGHPGSKLVVTITGVEATTDVMTDGIVATNHGTSGIYESAASDADKDGITGELQASFKMPTTYLTSHTYVVDYAKKMTIDPSDFLMNLGVDTLDVDGYNYFDSATTEITEAYGKVAIEDGKIAYTPTTMNWDGFDTFYVFGSTNNATVQAATANGNYNLWSKVSVIPANNVYYEDTFISTIESDGTGADNTTEGTVGIVYSGSWFTDTTGSNPNTNVEHPENLENQDNANHGWEDSLADDTGYSDGSAHGAEFAKDENGIATAKASFTFTGTGVDIYSRTNSTTGTIIVKVEPDAATKEKGINTKYFIVDTLAASGDYYQIPVVSYTAVKKTTTDEGTTEDVIHGTYTVTITVTGAADFEQYGNRKLFYLDGIRVYNPLSNEQEKDPIVDDGYGNAVDSLFMELRDKLLDSNTFNPENSGFAINGAVFIDQINANDNTASNPEGNAPEQTDPEETDPEKTDSEETTPLETPVGTPTTTTVVGDYKTYGPENEVYLAKGQSIVFKVNSTEHTLFFVGLKAPSGTATEALVTFGTDAEGNPVSAAIPVGHSTDMFYKVIPANGYIQITNNSDSLLSITKLKKVYTDDEAPNISDDSGIEIQAISADEALLFAARFAKAPLVSYPVTDGDADVPETDTPNVEIAVPEQPSREEQLREMIAKFVAELFGAINAWFNA